MNLQLRITSKRYPLVGILLFLACTSSTLPAPENDAITVKAEQVNSLPLAETLTVAGIVTPIPGRDIKLGSLIAGRVAKLQVTEGDAVVANQVLAEIESGPANDELTQARASENEAISGATAARSKKARTDDLFKQGVTSQQALELAAVESAAAEAAVNRTHAAVELASRRVSRSVIRAPFSGVIVSVFAHVNEVVEGNGQAILQLAAVQEVDLRASITAIQLRRLQVGQKASFTIAANGGPHPASVSTFSAALGSSGEAWVRLRVDNRDHLLTLGEGATAEIFLSEPVPVLAVPNSALLQNDNGTLSVMILQEGKVHRQNIRTAFRTKDRTVVEEGLQSGTWVVSEGGYSLPEGTPVQVSK